MTNQEILEKAIQKAIDGGWKRRRGVILRSGDVYTLDGDIVHPQTFIFNHDFAKALWPSGYCVCGELHNRGEVIVMEPGNTTLHSALPDWQYHLQRMVVAEDPIKYLGEHLDD